MVDKAELYIFLNVVIASVLTMAIGIEREKAHKSAGMRTNMIVGGFTCLVISLVDPVADFVELRTGFTVTVDPTRVFQAIVVGVSFIGAGTILKSAKGPGVKGLTTAATLLYSSGIGICTALEKYLLAVLLTLFVLAINHLMKYFFRDKIRRE